MVSFLGRLFIFCGRSVFRFSAFAHSSKGKPVMALALLVVRDESFDKLFCPAEVCALPPPAICAADLCSQRMIGEAAD